MNLIKGWTNELYLTHQCILTGPRCILEPVQQTTHQQRFTYLLSMVFYSHWLSTDE